MSRADDPDVWFGHSAVARDGRDGDGARPVPEATAVPAGPVAGPGALRVTLAPASAHGPAGPMVVDQIGPSAGTPDGPWPRIDGSERRVRLRTLDADRARLEGEGEAPRGIVLMAWEPVPGTPSGTVRREILVDGWRVVVDVEPERRARLRERATRGRGEGGRRGPLEVRAILPGRILAVTVSAGEAVTAGHQAMTIEAMKMQNELRVPRDGTIARVAVAPGQTIEVGDLLLVIE